MSISSHNSSFSNNKNSAWKTDNADAVSSAAPYELTDKEFKRTKVTLVAEQAIQLHHQNKRIKLEDLVKVQTQFKEKYKELFLVGTFVNKLYRFLFRKTEKKLEEVIKETQDRIEHITDLIKIVPGLTPQMKEAISHYVTVEIEGEEEQKKVERIRSIAQLITHGNVDHIISKITASVEIAEKFPALIADNAMPQGTFVQKTAAWGIEQSGFEKFKEFCSKREVDSSSCFQCALFIDTLLQDNEIVQKETLSSSDEVGPQATKKIDPTIYSNVLASLTSKRDAIFAGTTPGHRLLARYISILDAKMKLILKDIHVQGKGKKTDPAQTQHWKFITDFFSNKIFFNEVEKETKASHFLSSLGNPPQNAPTFGFYTTSSSPSLFLRMQIPQINEDATLQATQVENRTIDYKIESNMIVPIDNQTILPQLVAAYYLAHCGNIQAAKKMLSSPFTRRVLDNDELKYIRFLFKNFLPLHNTLKNIIVTAQPYHSGQSELMTTCIAEFGIDISKKSEDTSYTSYTSFKKPPLSSSEEEPLIQLDPKAIQGEEQKELFHKLQNSLQQSVSSLQEKKEEKTEGKSEVQKEYTAFIHGIYSVLSKNDIEPQNIEPNQPEFKNIYNRVCSAQSSNSSTVQYDIKTLQHDMTELQKSIELQRAEIERNELKLLLVLSKIKNSKSKNLETENDIDRDTIIILYAQERLDEVCCQEGSSSIANTTRLQQVKDVICAYLDARQKMQQMQRVESLLQKLEKIELERRKPPLDTTQYEKIRRDLISAVTASRVYNPIEFPRFQVFELFLDIYIKKEQFESLKRLSDSDKSVILQLLMGSGKTFLLLPLLGMLRANGSNISTIMIPDSLLPTVLTQIRSVLGSGFNQIVSQLPLPEGRKMTLQDLDNIQHVLDDVRYNRGCLLLSPNTKHILLNTFSALFNEYSNAMNLVEPVEEIQSKIVKLAHILALLEESESVIADEIDDLLKSQLQYIIPLGQPTPHNPVSLRLITELVLHAASDKEIEFDFVPLPETAEKKKKPYSLEEYHHSIKQKLVSKAIRMLQNEKIVGAAEKKKWQQCIQPDSTHKEHLERYLFIQHREDSMSFNEGGSTKNSTQSEKEKNEASYIFVSSLDAPSRERLAELRFAITRVLPQAFFSECNKEYGIDNQQKELVARPFAGSQNPTKTQFSNPIEQMCKTAQAYIKFGPPLAALTEICDTYGERLKKLPRPIGRGPCNTPGELHECIKTHRPALRWFMEKFVFQSIQVYPEHIASTPEKLVASSKAFSGITGTFWNVASMPRFQEMYPDVKTEMDMLAQFLAKEQKNPKEISLNDTKIASIGPILDVIGTDSNTLALVDSGGWLKDVNTSEFAQKILKVREDIEVVVYHNREGKIVFCGRDETEYLFTADEQTKLPLEKRFTIYTQQYTVGTHIDQLDTAQAVMTIGKKMILRDFEQAIFRMRKILQSQKVVILIDPEIQQRMKEKLCNVQPKDYLELTTLYRLLLTNQVERRLEENYSSSHQRVKSVLESALKRAILSCLVASKSDDKKPDFVEAHKIWQHGKEFFVSQEEITVPSSGEENASEHTASLSHSAWDRYGKIPQYISKNEKIEKEVEHYIKNFSKLSQLTTVKESLKSIIDIDAQHPTQDGLSLESIIKACYASELSETLLDDDDVEAYIGKQVVVQKSLTSTQTTSSHARGQRPDDIRINESLLYSLIASDEIAQNLSQIKDKLQNINATILSKKQQGNNVTASYRLYEEIKKECEIAQKTCDDISATVSKQPTIEARCSSAVLLARVQSLHESAIYLHEFEQAEEKFESIFSRYSNDVDEAIYTAFNVPTELLDIVKKEKEQLQTYLQECSLQSSSIKSMASFLKKKVAALEKSADAANSHFMQLNEETRTRLKIIVETIQIRKESIQVDSSFLALFEQVLEEEPTHTLVKKEDIGFFIRAVQECEIACITDQQKKCDTFEHIYRQHKQQSKEKIEALRHAIDSIKSFSKHTSYIAKIEEKCQEEEAILQKSEEDFIALKSSIHTLSLPSLPSSCMTTYILEEVNQYVASAQQEIALCNKITEQIGILTKNKAAVGYTPAQELIEALTIAKEYITSDKQVHTSFSQIFEQYKEIQSSVEKIKNTDLLTALLAGLQEKKAPHLVEYIAVLEKQFNVSATKLALLQILDSVEMPGSDTEEIAQLRQEIHGLSLGSSDASHDLYKKVVYFKAGMTFFQKTYQDISLVKENLNKIFDENRDFVSQQTQTALCHSIDNFLNRLIKQNKIELGKQNKAYREQTHAIQEIVSSLQRGAIYIQQAKAILSNKKFENNRLIPVFQIVNDAKDRIARLLQNPITCSDSMSLQQVQEHIKVQIHDLHNAVEYVIRNQEEWAKTAQDQATSALISLQDNITAIDALAYAVQDTIYIEQAKEFKKQTEATILLFQQDSIDDMFIKKFEATHTTALEFKKILENALIQKAVASNLRQGMEITQGLQYCDRVRQVYNNSLVELTEAKKPEYIEIRKNLLECENRAVQLHVEFDKKIRSLQQQYSDLVPEQKRITQDMRSRLQAIESDIVVQFKSIATCTTLQEVTACLEKIKERLYPTFIETSTHYEQTMRSTKGLVQQLKNAVTSQDACSQCIQNLLELHNQKRLSLYTLWNDSEVGPALHQVVQALVEKYTLLEPALNIAKEIYKNDEQSHAELQKKLVIGLQTALSQELEKESQTLLSSSISLESRFDEELKVQLELLQHNLLQKQEHTIEKFVAILKQCHIQIDGNIAAAQMIASCAIESQDIISTIQSQALVTIVEIIEKKASSCSSVELEEIQAFITVQKNIYERLSVPDKCSQHFVRYTELSKNLFKKLEATCRYIDEQIVQTRTKSIQFKLKQVAKRVLFQGGIAAVGGTIMATCPPTLSPIATLLFGYAYQDAVRMITQPAINKISHQLPKSIQPYAEIMMKMGVGVGASYAYTAYSNDFIANVTNITKSVYSAAAQSTSIGQNTVVTESSATAAQAEIVQSELSSQQQEPSVAAAHETDAFETSTLETNVADSFSHNEKEYVAQSPLESLSSASIPVMQNEHVLSDQNQNTPIESISEASSVLSGTQDIYGVASSSAAVLPNNDIMIQSTAMGANSNQYSFEKEDMKIVASATLQAQTQQQATSYQRSFIDIAKQVGTLTLKSFVGGAIGYNNMNMVGGGHPSHKR